MATAILDIGSHSVRMLYTRGGQTHRLTHITRLREGMKDGLLAIRSIRRTAGAIARFVALAKNQNNPIAAFATSAMREARNARLLTAFCRRALGFSVDIVSGEREAQLAYLGAAQGQTGAIGVLDIGGGSTEVTWGENGRIALTMSFPIGAVRMRDMGVCAGEMSRRATEALRACPPPPPEINWRGIGGTITSLAAMEQALDPYEEKKVHGFPLTREQIAHWVARLEQMTPAQLESLHGLQKQRAPVILAGASILLGAMEALGLPAIAACTTDNLDGYAMEMAFQKQRQ